MADGYRDMRILCRGTRASSSAAPNLSEFYTVSAGYSDTLPGCMSVEPLSPYAFNGSCIGHRLAYPWISSFVTQRDHGIHAGRTYGRNGSGGNRDHAKQNRCRYIG